MDIWNRKIILYGSKKIQADFKFLFEELNVMQDDICDIGNIIKENRRDYFIVVCEKKRDFDFENLVQEWRLKYKRDYEYIEDFFLYYNPIFLKRGNRKLAIWGTGVAASELWEILKRRGDAFKVDFFIDNAQSKISFKEKEVVSPEEIQGRNDLFIIVATYKYQWEIYKQLDEYGYQQQKDYIHCTAVNRDYSKLLKKVCFAEKRYSYYCDRPFGYCDVIGEELYLCCPDFLPVSAGSMQSESFMSCWNSYVARILRLSILNGTFVFCNKQYCDLIDFKENEEQGKVDLKYKSTQTEYPNTLMVGIDYSCNLKCPSCRKEICIANDEEKNEINRQAEDLLEHVIPYVGRLWMAGSGEVFFSKIYGRILNDERCKRRTNISILSNGTLFDEKKWKFLEESYKLVEVVISMDGIKDETIEKLRRGANAQKIKKNLEFLGSLRKSDRIRKLFLNCVLQADNVNELYELLEYCRKIGVDKVQFLKLKNNGIYLDDDSFDKMSIFDNKDCLKEEFSHHFTKEVLLHPLADWFNSTNALGVERKPRLDKYDTL